MRRYLVWSLVLHVAVFVGGAMLAPLHGFMSPSRPDTIITVGLVDFPGAGKTMGSPAKLRPPTPAPDQTIPLKPTQQQTLEKVKEKTGEEPAAKKEKRDTTHTIATAKSSRSDSAGGVSGTLTEGTADGDVWGVESGAGVNPYHRAGFAAIRSNWRNPVVGPVARKCVVKFRIKRSGVIEDIDLEQSSGSDLFDRAALRAVRLTQAWPQFPPSWEEDEQIIHLEFEYRP